MTRWVVLSVQLAYKGAAFFFQMKKITALVFQNMSLTYFRTGTVSKILLRPCKGNEISLLETGLKHFEHWNLHTVTLKSFVHGSLANPGRLKMPFVEALKEIYCNLKIDFYCCHFSKISIIFFCHENQGRGSKSGPEFEYSQKTWIRINEFREWRTLL